MVPFRRIEQRLIQGGEWLGSPSLSPSSSILPCIITAVLIPNVVKRKCGNGSGWQWFELRAPTALSIQDYWQDVEAEL